MEVRLIKTITEGFCFKNDNTYCPTLNRFYTVYRILLINNRIYYDLGEDFSWDLYPAEFFTITDDHLHFEVYCQTSSSQDRCYSGCQYLAEKFANPELSNTDIKKMFAEYNSALAEFLASDDFQMIHTPPQSFKDYRILEADEIENYRSDVEDGNRIMN